MSRNLIVYKVEYRNPSDPWDYHSRKKFVKTKRIIMPLSEYDNSGDRWKNHRWIKRQFRKQMSDKYYIDRVTKA
jgi:hypothetical protein